MPFRVVELALEIVLEAMRGQTPAQKEKMWDWYIQDVENWREFFKLNKKSDG